jgi:hypothetical protein
MSALHLAWKASMSGFHMLEQIVQRLPEVNIIYFLPFYFKFSSLFSSFTTHPIYLPHPYFFTTQLQPARILYSKSTQAVRLKALVRSALHVTPTPPHPPCPTRPYPALPAPPPLAGSLAASTASSAALPPTAASSTSTPCQQCRPPSLDR